ncbi:MAG: tRNA (adenosine(37)-N6)-threonylcarbamoyltransferase complex transferase subunit TsaD [Candidatus Peribacteraceae bacterium]|nr:tRNA (adenosine(37)-N6)-threonylcarbamoyltransferase complex transferase subunit TsaD [Candidatus Peribacteraceae bacterium]MBP9850966.1 tRNA (adenosine(37)-N6)-threonylcarbamoyltransferase complex transferase subunit TsaD [Candidatus Peribacteraceae bacterium]
MLILGIETSCDETSAAVVRDGREVLSCVISSSKNDFNALGGVIPEDAARKQLESILPVLTLTLEQAKISHKDLDAIAVTYGPGLLGSLLVGTSTARVLEKIWKKPLLPVHHTLGHLSSTWLKEVKSEKWKVKSGEKCIEDDEPTFPILTLSVSGGHTDLWYRTSHTTGTLAGSTRDDAAGEAYDKGAVLLGLPYPGGPALAALAEKGNETACAFPHPLKHDTVPDFSFSGLKTSLKYLLRDMGPKAEDDKTRADIAASFQNAINAHLLSRIEMALKIYPETKELHLVGGVSANTHLRARAAECGARAGVTVRLPEKLTYCTDNAAMIASAAFFVRQENDTPHGAFQTHATSSLQALLQPVS